MPEFYCPQCQKKTTQGVPKGPCPNCQTGLLREIGVQPGPPRSGRPAAKWASYRGSRTTTLLVVGGLALAGFLFFKYGRIALDRIRFRSESVEGRFESNHLEAAMRFPAGWRRLSKSDTSVRLPSGMFRMSAFFRGGTSEDPDAWLELGMLELRGDDAADGDERFLTFCNQAVGMLREHTTLSQSFDMAPCNLEETSAGPAGVTVGEGRFRGGSGNALVYAWARGDRVFLALLLSSDPFGVVRSEMEVIAGGLEPL